MNNSQILNNQNCFCKQYFKNVFRKFIRGNSNALSARSLDSHCLPNFIDENDIFYLTDGGKYISLQHLQSLVLTSATTSKIEENANRVKTLIPTADRIQFFREGVGLYTGVSIPRTKIPNDSLETLLNLITQLLVVDLKQQGEIFALYTPIGRQITHLDELKTGEIYLCRSYIPNNNNDYQNPETVNTAEPITLTKIRRPKYIHRNFKRQGAICPRTIILIKTGPNPKRIEKLFLNRSNCRSFEDIQESITVVLKFSIGQVNQIFTLWGFLVEKLEDFFGEEDIFFACGNTYFHYTNYFDIDTEELEKIEKICMQDRSLGLAYREFEIQTIKPAVTESSRGVVSNIINDSPLLLKKKYMFDGMVGAGHFALVMKIKKLSTKKPYALKIVKKIKTEQNAQLYKAEMNILLTIKHPHIIFCKEVFECEKKYYIVMNYVSGGNLHQALQKVKRFSEDECRLIMKQFFSALVYIHSKSITHRDIKLENVLVERDANDSIRNIKLIDFGLSIEGAETSHKKCGTPLYMAPELILEISYNKKVDVWSAGVMMYTLLCGDMPFQNEVRNILYKLIIMGKYKYPESIEDQLTIECKDLISNSLKLDPNLRLSSKNALRHPWTKGKKFK